MLQIYTLILKEMRKKLHHRDESWLNTHRLSKDKWQKQRTENQQTSVFKPPLQDALEGEREELEALTGVKLILELHPVQTQCVQEGWQTFHYKKNGDCENSKEAKDYG